MEKKDNINIWEQDLKQNSGGFKMPDSYLENLDDAILEKISSKEEAPRARTISLQSWFIVSASIAASLIIALFLLIPLNSGQIESMQFAETELEWDQYASFEESWIMEELESIDDEQDMAFDDEIDYLMDGESMTSDEIIDEIFENE